MELGYTDYAREPYIDVFDDLERFYGFNFAINMGFILDLIHFHYNHYQNGTSGTLTHHFDNDFLDFLQELLDPEGDFQFYLPAYDAAWLYDNERDFDVLMARVFSDLYLYFPSSSPFRRISTNWFFFEKFYSSSMHSSNLNLLSLPTLVVLDSFDDFWNFLWVYDGIAMFFTNA